MRTRLPCCLAAALLLSLPLTAQDPARKTYDWPQWRGPHRDGISRETGLLTKWPEDGPKLLWTTKKIGRGYSSVVVAGGRIFTVSDRKGSCQVIAFDEATGQELWATRIAGGGQPNCTPTVDGDRLYALSRDGELACLGVEKGEVRWKKSYTRDLGGRMMSGWGYSESPLVDGEKLVVTPGGDTAALVALNKQTGEVIWKAPIKDAGGSGYASVVIAEAGSIRQYVTLLGHSGGIVGVDARDGKLLWRYNKMANGTANIPTPLVRGDLVFTSTGYGAGSALLQLVPTQTGGIELKQLYFLKGRVLQNHHGGMVLLGDHIYGGHGHNDGQPFCLNIKTGEFAWAPRRGPGSGSAAVVYADGHLYFRYEDGVMALIEASPQDYRLKSTFTLPRYTGTPSWPHPVVANGRLYLRGNDVLLCYDVKQP
jgi:outer membrane protein assembly factor BamB